MIYMPGMLLVPLIVNLTSRLLLAAHLMLTTRNSQGTMSNDEYTREPQLHPSQRV